ncbi:putative Enoyl-CoA hydratase [Nitrospira japonica]|uniref:Putative Enoyl-CoA hydratase n=1 Tax=Nitrospira japonica TaxID=1325564 RepID=A0A1W1I165_9BACT|nr:enoyl-CoA hydratase-related protein [Nitrospira japonica]SLM46724.1 putative Enoyl-CoA hydratase [Nitrospira japonica]
MTHPAAILIESHDGVTRVTLNRPHRRNAFDAGMVEALSRVFDESGRNPSVRAVVLTGNGPAFCAGADIDWMRSGGTRSAPERRKDAEELMRMFRAIDECPCPVIARVQGPAFGGGVGMIAACDIAVAVEDATFALSEVRLGMVPSVIAPVLLRKTGESFLRRCCLTGEPFSASAAKQGNLIHDVVEKTQLDARVDELIQSVLRAAPQAAQDTKALLHRLPALSGNEQWNTCVESNVRARLSDEAQEGFRAFLERRAPVWTAMPGKRGSRSAPE